MSEIKVTRKSNEALEEEFAKTPTRVQGRWVGVASQVEKTGRGVEVTGITRGQGWALKRACTDKQLRCKVIALENNEYKAIVLPPVKEE